MVRDDQVYLAHIKDALQQISTYTDGMDNKAFLGNRMVQDAVIRQFEISARQPKICRLASGSATLSCRGRIWLVSVTS